MLFAAVLSKLAMGSAGRFSPFDVRDAREQVLAAKEALKTRAFALRNAPAEMEAAEVRQIQAEYRLRLALTRVPPNIQMSLVEINALLEQLAQER